MLGLAHPSASVKQVRTAKLLIEQGMKTGDWKWELVESALTEVCSPWPAPAGKRIHRGLGARDLSIGIPEVVRSMKNKHDMILSLRDEGVSTEQLDEARRRYLSRDGYGPLTSFTPMSPYQLDVLVQSGRPLKCFFKELATLLAPDSCRTI
ncbi:hypothetical protein ACWGQ5_54780 [Streptomyces sp. NPDC055722]